jgi:PAS domain S-box-containing protein
MADNSPLEMLIQILSPTIVGSLDPVAVVDNEGVVVHANKAMKNFLGLKGKTIRGNPVFSIIVHLTEHNNVDPIEEVIKTGEIYQKDQAPAEVDGEKKRLLIKAYALKDLSGSNIVGAFIILRDTTGEVLLSAKYQKVMKENEDLKKKVEKLENQVDGLKQTIYDVANVDRIRG